LSFTSLPYTTSGTAVVTSTVEATGLLYSYSAGFERAAFASNQYLKIDSPSSAFTLDETGYYVVTVDWQRVTGNPQMYVWDRSANQFVVGVTLPEANRWYTVVESGYSIGNAAFLFLDFSGGATTENVQMANWWLPSFGIFHTCQTHKTIWNQEFLPKIQIR